MHQFEERSRGRMAQKVQTLLIDDLDGGEADGTVRFGLDGAEYEIDLSAEHAEALRKALAPYLGAARRAPGSVARRAGRTGRRAGNADGPDPTTVREWAKSQGIGVKDRGRVSAELVAKFKTATSQ
jgi:Lsr2